MYVTMWLLFLVFTVIAGYLLHKVYKERRSCMPFETVETNLMVFSILVSAVSAGYIFGLLKTTLQHLLFYFLIK
jgi:hypothetical protein